ncbi:MAG: dihydroxy-acid dehydratase [Pseudomonadales bacterium]|nr:dihydroxy-acid dehydratase [Pseudomonadales bacterium]|tara:strand:+ start:2079 stop:2648 length:570 start_codon:yes stop_codon:yes gene_type:complete
MTSDTDASGRRLIHQRKVECLGYLRADGLWDIEGRLADSKTHPAVLTDGSIVETGQVYHGMLVRLTLDDEFTIHEVEVSMPHVPTNQCRGAATFYNQLIGVRIGPGFTRKAKELFGGNKGCVHLTELLQPIATTAFQTIPMARSLVAPRNERDVDSYRRATHRLIDTCYALRASGPVALNIKSHMDPAE